MTVPLAPSARAALIDAVDGLLPQTQCQRCGYSGCRPYATAVVDDAASIALCPPGGEATRQQLAQLLARADDAPPLVDEARRVARIVEADCIGCARCLAACPVDAIIGAAGRMHTVFSAWCTGCDLCAPVCPTDCISMDRVTEDVGDSAQTRAHDARARYRRRLARARAQHEHVQRHELVPLESDPEALRATVVAALARQQRRSDL